MGTAWSISMDSLHPWLATKWNVFIGMENQEQDLKVIYRPVTHVEAQGFEEHEDFRAWKRVEGSLLYILS